MKIESVTRVNLDGSYEVLYVGNDRTAARKIYKENMMKKDEFMSLFQQTGYTSRTMSKQGFIAHNESKFKKSEPVIVEEPKEFKPCKPRKKKTSQED